MAAPGGDVAAGVAEYERLRESAGRGRRRMGLGVLAARGMVAYLKAAAALGAVVAPRRPDLPTAPAVVVSTLEPEVIRVWSRMVLAHANSP